jgi:hypothetical protein
MARIVAGVGPSDARAELEAQPDAAPVFEPLPEIAVGVVEQVQVSEPVAPTMEPEPVAVAEPVAPAVEDARVPAVDAPVAAAKGGAA